MGEKYEQFSVRYYAAMMILFMASTSIMLTFPDKFSLELALLSGFFMVVSTQLYLGRLTQMEVREQDE